MRLFYILIVLALVAGPGRAQDGAKQAPTILDQPEKHGIGKKIQSPELAAAVKGGGLLVVTFTGADCPISKLYRPKLDRLARQYEGKGVAFMTVNDAESPLVALLDARRTTEVFVLDDGCVLRYRGAIDDQYGIGYAKDAATRSYLTDALDALLAKKAPPVAATEAPGCAIERPSKPPPAEPPAKPGVPAASPRVSFHKDVEPIFQKHCQECHRPGEIGPFSLLTYAKAKASAARIKEAVTTRRMPPWHADPKYGKWENDRSLSAKEMDTIVRWVKDGAPEGNTRDAPPARKWSEGWAIGTPDAVYQIPQPVTVPAEGTIPYRTFSVRTDQKEDRWVQAIEVRPGARKVVHHIVVACVGRPGTAGGNRPTEDGLERGYFGLMVPGERPTIYPEGMGKLLPAGATLAFQIHYAAVGEAAEDQSSIGFVFAKRPPRQEVITIGIVDREIRIPPGAANHREEASYRFPHDAKILSLVPHAHLRSKSFRYVAVPAGGKEEILLDIPRYDFNWQLNYRFQEPRLVKKGTTIRVIAHYDNSKANPANPDPTKEVRWGQQTWEEMLIGYLDYVRVGP